MPRARAVDGGATGARRPSLELRSIEESQFRRSVVDWCWLLVTITFRMFTSRMARWVTILNMAPEKQTSCDLASGGFSKMHQGFIFTSHPRCLEAKAPPMTCTAVVPRGLRIPRVLPGSQCGAGYVDQEQGTKENAPVIFLKAQSKIVAIAHCQKAQVTLPTIR